MTRTTWRGRLAVGLLLVGTAACNTMEGLGEDLSSLGDSIALAASDELPEGVEAAEETGDGDASTDG